MATAASARFLDPAVLVRLGSMDLRARTIVEGFLSGLHRSPFKGFSVEFAEYRQYYPGDALSTIDWKVFARSDRYYVKKFEEETNLEATLLVDASGSMGYGGELTKLQYATYLAAALAYLVHRQRDAPGLVLFDENIRAYEAASRRPGHLWALLATLERARPANGTDAVRPLHLLAESIVRRGLVVLISDLLEEPGPVIEGLRHFRYRGHDVIVFHVLHRDEREFPFDQDARFRDLETGREVLTQPSAVRAGYLRAMDELVETYRRELRLAGIDYCQLLTDQPFDAGLLAYLAARARRV